MEKYAVRKTQNLFRSRGPFGHNSLLKQIYVKKNPAPILKYNIKYKNVVDFYIV